MEKGIKMKTFLSRRKSYPKYPKYKESGFDWLGEIPEGWEVLPIWMLFYMGRGRVISNEEILDNPGEYPVYSSQTEDEGILGYIATYDFDGEYITWTTDGANAGTVFYRKGKFNCTNVCGALKDKNIKKIDLRYINYATGRVTKVFVRYDINPKLMNNVIAGIRIQVPTYEEQGVIADFLDRETARIDNLIEKKQKLVELLKEKRAALISQAVTKGIDPNAKMKDSGIEWIGEIPEGWEVKRLKYLVRNITDKASQSNENNNIIALENIESWKGALIYPEDQKILEGDLKTFKSGDILFGKLRPYLAKVILSQSDGLCVGELLVLRTYSNILPKYLFYRLLTSEFIKIVSDSTQGAKMPRAEWEFIGNIKIGFSSLSEQLKIVNFLDGKTGKIDRLIQKIESQIEKLKEYHVALISEAATGKIKVG